MREVLAITFIAALFVWSQAGLAQPPLFQKNSPTSDGPPGIEKFNMVPPSRESTLDALLQIQKNQGRIVTYAADGKSVKDLMLFFRNVNENVVKSLKYFPELESTSLPHVATDDWVAYLKPLKNLKKLGLPPATTDAGLKHIESLPKLEELHASGAKFTDAGMKSLAKIKTLKAVVLIGTKVGDDGLNTLKSLPALTVVNVRNAKVTKEGVEAFKKAKPKCKVFH